MQTYVAREGRQIGNYGEDQLRSLYERGHLLSSDHYWREGMTEWSTLGVLLPPQEVAKVEPRPPTPDDEPVPGWLIPVLSVGGALLVGLILLGFIVAHYEKRSASLRVPMIVKKEDVQQPPDEASTQPEQPAPTTTTPHAQPAASAPSTPQPPPVPVKTPEEIAQIKDPVERAQAEETASLAQEIAKRGQACRDAEKDMLDLGFTPTKLTSLGEIDKRRQAILAAMPILQAMVDYISNLDTGIRTNLLAKGVTKDAIDTYIAGTHQTGKTESLLIYWKQEASISADLLANLDLLKKHYGEWHIDGERVIFNDDTTLGVYQANIEKLKTDISIQQTVQADLLKTQGQ